MSLSPRSRLSTDSARSPSGAATAHSTPKTQRLAGAEGSEAEDHGEDEHPDHRRRPRPATRPSTVLLGLTEVSGVRPNWRPTAKPPTS